MKTVIAASIPLILALIGYLVSARYSESSEFWECFLTWHKKIKSEITFSQRSLPEIFDYDSDKDLFLTVAKEYLSDKVIKTKLAFLSKDETAFLIKYLERLGTTDKNSQLDFLNSMENDLENFRKVAERKNKNVRPLFVKLGFLLGLIVFILII